MLNNKEKTLQRHNHFLYPNEEALNIAWQLERKLEAVYAALRGTASRQYIHSPNQISSCKTEQAEQVKKPKKINPERNQAKIPNEDRTVIQQIVQYQMSGKEAKKMQSKGVR